jgi:hypothetical protein
MTFTILLALAGLTLSGVAIYYSVIGLTAIFSAAFWPIVVMGTSLEVSKLVAASWLKANWTRIPRLMKLYMSIAVIVLMVITSMGIFGFLSKAHSDQNLVSGDVQSKIAIYDEKIKTAKENIESNRKQLKQMDEAVDQVMARSQDEKGADKANAIRKSQSRDRVALTKDIEANQKLVVQLNDEAAPIRAEVRKVEAEVGPIKYIAAFIYGDNPDANILEKAVTWVIISIITVFDPLAILMLLASQMTWQWRKEELVEGDSPSKDSVDIVSEQPTVTEPSNDPAYEQDDGPLTEEQIEQLKASVEAFKSEPYYGTPSANWPFPSFHETTVSPPVEETPKEEPIETVDSTMPVADIDAWNKMIEAAEAEVAKEKLSNTGVEDRVAKGESYIDGDGNEKTFVDVSEIVDANNEAKKRFEQLITETLNDKFEVESERSRDILKKLKRNLELSEEDKVFLNDLQNSKKKTYMIKNQDGNKEVLTIEDTSKTPNSPN